MTRRWFGYAAVGIASGLAGIALGARAAVGFLASAQDKTRTELFADAATQRALRGALDEPGLGDPAPSESVTDLFGDLETVFEDGVEEFDDGGIGVDIDLDDAGRDGQSEGGRQ